MIFGGYHNTNTMDLPTCTTIFDNIYEMEAFPLDRRGLSLLRLFVTFCIGKAFVSSSFEVYSEICSEKKHSPSKPCLFDHQTAPSQEIDCIDHPIMSEQSHSKYEKFNVIAAVPYSTVHNTDINLSILIPKKLKGLQGCPLIVRFHGGYLTTGSRLHPDWFQIWILDYAVGMGAIIVAPDYRLLPEANGADIVEDIGSFWKFASEHLNSVLSAEGGCSVNTKNTLVIGDSAGSHLAAISALHFCKFQNVQIKAMISGFGMVDMNHPHFTEADQKKLPGINDWMPNTLINDAVQEADAKEKETGIRPYKTSVKPPDRTNIGSALLQRGRYKEFMKDNALSNNIKTIRNLSKNSPLPGFWLYHGLADKIVPHTVSEGFVTALETELNKRHEDEHCKVLYTPRKGAEHGFDKDATTKDKWMREGLDHIECYWGR